MLPEPLAAPCTESAPPRCSAAVACRTLRFVREYASRCEHAACEDSRALVARVPPRTRSARSVPEPLTQRRAHTAPFTNDSTRFPCSRAMPTVSSASDKNAIPRGSRPQVPAALESAREFRLRPGLDICAESSSAGSQMIARLTGHALKHSWAARTRTPRNQMRRKLTGKARRTGDSRTFNSNTNLRDW